jgi:hypothetical protein
MNFSPHTCYLPCRSHSPQHNHSNYTGSFFSFLQPPNTSSVFCPNILNRLVSNIITVRFPTLRERASFIPIQNHGQNYTFVYYLFLCSCTADEYTKCSGLKGRKRNWYIKSSSMYIAVQVVDTLSLQPEHHTQFHPSFIRNVFLISWLEGSLRTLAFFMTHAPRSSILSLKNK